LKTGLDFKVNLTSYILYISHRRDKISEVYFFIYGSFVTINLHETITLDQKQIALTPPSLLKELF
jgi:hypothetical protein